MKSLVLPKLSAPRTTIPRRDGLLLTPSPPASKLPNLQSAAAAPVTSCYPQTWKQTIASDSPLRRVDCRRRTRAARPLQSTEVASSAVFVVREFKHNTSLRDDTSLNSQPPSRCSPTVPPPPPPAHVCRLSRVSNTPRSTSVFRLLFVC